jgi:hypothetical protein
MLVDLSFVRLTKNPIKIDGPNHHRKDKRKGQGKAKERPTYA